ncbi:MAG: TAT-variant-translocated molybdopterin oxidoreductase [Rhodothermales bacterium]|nr:TAT-variant-translocated molybdopterin oxidoreductase [Rhodothermales bacterium]
MIDLPILDDAADAAAPEAQAPAMTAWRSVPQFQRDPAFASLARHEFLPGAAEPPSGASRRQFLQLLGATAAFAGLTGCRRPVEQVLPYTRKPEEIIPGIPIHFATAMPFRGLVRPVVVESHEGRPTKVEGNPEHPSRASGTSPFEQASVLTLYDPDRSHRILQAGEEATWRDFTAFAGQLGAGTRLAVLAEATSSPTVEALRQQLQQRFPALRWVTYRDGGDDPETVGMQTAFGQPFRPQYHFDEAAVIVSLDADFLGPTERNFVHNNQTFAAGRRLTDADAGMSRLYVVESTYSSTGAMADNRLRLRAADIPAFAAGLARRLGVAGTAQPGARFSDHPYVLAIAEDLQRAGSRGVVLAGETQPPAVHALAAAINGALGSLGQTVTLFDTGADPVRPQHEELAELTAAMAAGEVDVLLTYGVNPVYSAPPALGFAAAMARVPETIHLGLWLDETAAAARWHLPRTHYLEAWGDGRSYDGTLSVIQPLIAPLYEAAHSEVEVLGALATGLDQAGYDLVRAAWRDAGVLTGNFEEGWRQALHDGFVPDTGYATTTAAAAAPDLGVLTALPVLTEDELEVVVRLDPTVLDGSYANNAWCMELPDPVTKIVWDNVAVMSPATAEALGVEAEYDEGRYEVSLVTLTVGDQAVTLPVWVLPGHPDGSIGVTLGYGRQIASSRERRESGFWDTDEDTDIYGQGALANAIGVNVAVLRPTVSTNVIVGADVAAAGGSYEIVTTQDHGALDPEARPIVRMGTYDQYRANPDFVEGMGEPVPGGYETFEGFPPLWEEHPSNQPATRDNLYYRNQWGMAIDLNACTGCNACIVACQSENNILVVGKESVGRGREMHWLRIDRYFVTPHAGLGEHTDHEDVSEEIPANPLMVWQPMPCQHCENAPCESVCPVAATVHSPDGTNQMIYNRCIGTRYCSNNCPYKVRRYNWFNWAKTLPLTVQMAMNPDVSVRFRGVMEKCSFCIQRIRHTQRLANLESRNVRDGEVRTACQEACPADAIVFGDLNDPTSEVTRWKASPRAYQALAELNIQPRVSYLGRVYNPNPALLAVREA